MAADRRTAPLPAAGRVDSVPVAEDDGALMRTASAAHEAGRFDEAERLYTDLQRRHPDNAELLHRLGVVALQTGRHADAVARLRRACDADADNPEPLVNLGISLGLDGQPLAAEEVFRAALQRAPRHPRALLNLAGSLEAQDRLDEAIACCRRLLVDHEDSPDIGLKLAGLLERTGAREDAADLLDGFCARLPDRPDLHATLANLLRLLDQPERAEGHYRTAIRLRPDFAEALCNLGNLLLDRDDTTGAEAAYRQAISHRPKLSEAHANLAAALEREDRREAAIEALRHAVAVQPAFHEAWNRLGMLYRDLNRSRDAATAFRKAVELCPDAGAYWSNLAGVLAWSGRIEQAVPLWRRGLRTDTGRAALHSNLLFALSFDPSVAAEDLRAEYARYGQRQGGAGNAASQKAAASQRPVEPDRTLRVGFLSADFRDHSNAFAFGPMVVGLAAAGFEAVLYANQRGEDGVTDMLRQNADWVPCRLLDDEELDVRIRGDGIDILIDLSGHARDNRLPVFARRPAPVQLSWINPVGLPEIDWCLTDATFWPEDEDWPIAEKPWRLEIGALPFLSPTGRPQPPVPRRADAPVVFGSFNNSMKINDGVISTWSAVLARVPDSRLLLKYGTLDDGDLVAALRRRFEAHGIDGRRIGVRGLTPRREHMAAWRHVDVALDCFPCNGGVTTWEALWMGVPVVTFPGDRPTGRATAAILRSVGLEDLVAADGAGFIDLAAALGGDRDRRDAARQMLPDRLEHAPILQPGRYAQAVGDALRQIWQGRCSGRDKPPRRRPASRPRKRAGA